MQGAPCFGQPGRPPGKSHYHACPPDFSFLPNLLKEAVGGETFWKVLWKWTDVFLVVLCVHLQESMNSLCCFYLVIYVLTFDLLWLSWPLFSQWKFLGNLPQWDFPC